MRIFGYAVSVVGLAIATAWPPVPAHACSCSSQPLLKFVAVPQDGALNVPLNAAARIGGSFKSGSVSVEDGAGQPVAVTIDEAAMGGRAAASGQKSSRRSRGRRRRRTESA